MNRLSLIAIALTVALSAPLKAAPSPEMVGEGVISTGADEFGGSITPDGGTIYFNRNVSRSYLYIICVAHQRHGQWAAPAIAPFSGHYRDSDPVLSPDGKRLYFVSDRPWPGQKAPNFDVWVVDLDGPHPNEPRHLEGAINSEANEYFASEAADGTLYFASARAGGTSDCDLYRARRVDGAYPVAETLGPDVNPPRTASLDLIVAPDQSFIILGSFGQRPGSVGDSDLFISRQHDGKWTTPESLAINTTAREYSPRLSPDGEWLLFASERGLPTEPRDDPRTYDELLKRTQLPRNGLGDIYRIRLRDLGIDDRRTR
jgi:hypothetical protein